ncbi:hypothetical protein E5Q_03208 [Mixia osmundae IAM 14324]|uniref:Uncharacterized protein n=1 Tax=Mixia osmundae (strain CBS 9802 / IAM 14324 / JCM 22182 / KY 12970) TaxID=764103 RepID=G7E130_MIXOS|nr:hypothetical protein E5Q_03208 [Mixia osmundae IAM 14324]
MHPDSRKDVTARDLDSFSSPSRGVDRQPSKSYTPARPSEINRRRLTRPIRTESGPTIKRRSSETSARPSNILTPAPRPHKGSKTPSRAPPLIIPSLPAQGTSATSQSKSRFTPAGSFAAPYTRSASVFVMSDSAHEDSPDLAQRLQEALALDSHDMPGALAPTPSSSSAAGAGDSDHASLPIHRPHNSDDSLMHTPPMRTANQTGSLCSDDTDAHFDGVSYDSASLNSFSPGPSAGGIDALSGGEETSEELHDRLVQSLELSNLSGPAEIQPVPVVTPAHTSVPPAEGTSPSAPTSLLATHQPKTLHERKQALESVLTARQPDRDAVSRNLAQALAMFRQDEIGRQFVMSPDVSVAHVPEPKAPANLADLSLLASLRSKLEADDGTDLSNPIIGYVQAFADSSAQASVIRSPPRAGDDRDRFPDARSVFSDVSESLIRPEYREQARQRTRKSVKSSSSGNGRVSMMTARPHKRRSILGRTNLPSIHSEAQSISSQSGESHDPVIPVVMPTPGSSPRSKRSRHSSTQSHLADTLGKAAAFPFEVAGSFIGRIILLLLSPLQSTLAMVLLGLVILAAGYIFILRSALSVFLSTAPMRALSLVSSGATHPLVTLSSISGAVATTSSMLLAMGQQHRVRLRNGNITLLEGSVVRSTIDSVACYTTGQRCSRSSGRKGLGIMTHRISGQARAARDTFNTVADALVSSNELHYASLWELGAAITAAVYLPDSDEISLCLLQLGNLMRDIKTSLTIIQAKALTDFGTIVYEFRRIESTIKGIESGSAYTVDDMTKQLDSLFDRISYTTGSIVNQIDSAIPIIDEASDVAQTVKGYLYRGDRMLSKEIEDRPLWRRVVEYDTYKAKQLNRDMQLTQTSILTVRAAHLKLMRARDDLHGYAVNVAAFKDNLIETHLADHALLPADEVAGLHQIMDSFENAVKSSQRPGQKTIDLLPQSQE